MKVQIRRSLVVTATGASLVLGAAAVQTAAAWVQTTVPSSDPALAAGRLQDQLAAEQARSATLQAQVEALLAQAGQFNTALTSASDRVASDVLKAAALRAQLALEQKQLATLKAAAAAAAKAAAHKTAATPPPTHTTTGASGAAGGGDDGGD